ncbi:MAG: DNA/RNA nuclease SfsA [Spirochaetales bacterium]|nr:DNA/RNA nuclease SfsA [Spirochaetales bacterium]
MVYASFLRRLNRFVVECRLESGEAVLAHLPNPGRLWELLYPGVRMALADGKTGKYAYGVLGVQKDEKWVYLHTLGNNDLAERLLKSKSVAGLEEYSIIRREVSPPASRCRFDFLLEKDGEPLWLEVKMCSLFQGKAAMFPDAPTVRGQHHLEELAKLHDEGYACAVLFIVQDLEADYFLPEYHTDPRFAELFYEFREKIHYYAVGTAVKEDLTWKDEKKQIKIPLEKLPLHNRDEGVYLMLLEVEEESTVTVGSLGERVFPAGWYIYVGSARKNLTKRMERHVRKRKKYHWHLDYLRSKASTVKAVPIRTAESAECLLAASMDELFPLEASLSKTLLGFGCSDCDCDRHLFYSPQTPLDNKGFIEKLLYWRMEKPLSDL